MDSWSQRSVKLHRKTTIKKESNPNNSNFWFVELSQIRSFRDTNRTNTVSNSMVAERRISDQYSHMTGPSSLLLLWIDMRLDRKQEILITEQFR